MSIVNVWAPKMKTCWSGSHIRTRYSNNRTWALMPGIRKYFKRPQSLNAAMVGGWFSAFVLSSSCSRSHHSSTMFVAIYLHKKHTKMINDLIHEMNLFYWLNFSKKNWVMRYSQVTYYAQCELLVGGLRPTCENESFSQVPYGPPARMPPRIYGSKTNLKQNF